MAERYPLEEAARGTGLRDRLAVVASALLAALWLVQLAYLLTRWPPLVRLSVVLLAPFLLLALLQASRPARLLFAIVWAASCAIAFGLGRASVLWAGLEQAVVFGAFLPSLLLLRATAQVSPRMDALRAQAAKLPPGHAAYGSLLGAHVLGSVLSVGAMGLLALGLAHQADERARLQCATAAVRGLATAVMWSPFFVAMGFCSQLVPAAPLAQVMFAGSGLGLVGLVLSVRLFTPHPGWRAGWQAIVPLGALAGPLAISFAAVLALNALGYPGLQAVSLALPVLCGAYLMGRDRQAAVRVARVTFQHFGRLSDELLLVVGAMLLGVCVAALPDVQSLARDVRPGVVPGSVLPGVLALSLFGLGQLGIHPMIGAGLLLPVLANGSFGTHPVALVAAAVFAWGLSSASSVWTSPFAAASTAFGVPIGRLWSPQMLRYTVLLGLVGSVYLGLLNTWLTWAS